MYEASNRKRIVATSILDNGIAKKNSPSLAHTKAAEKPRVANEAYCIYKR